MTRPVLTDAAARKASQTVFDRPLLLEAGAGTGKTTTLVARSLAWCLGPGWEEARHRFESAEPHKVAAEVLQGVVAITFTEAAAAEMAARIAQSLAQVVDGREDEIAGLNPELLQPDQPAVRRTRAGLLLETFDHLTVSTIHAFCFGLLTDHPLQAGLHPDLRVDADGREIEAVARIAVERRVQDAYRASDDSPFLVLASHGIGPAQLMEAVVRWLSIGAPLDLLEHNPLERGKIETFATELALSITQLHACLGDRVGDLAANRKARAVVEALRDSRAALIDTQLPAFDLADSAERLREIWRPDMLERLRDWGNGKLTREERDRLGEVRGAVQNLAAQLHRSLRHVRRLDPVLLSAARRALLPILRQIEQDLRARGVITFSGLLRESRSLLREHPEVVRRLRQRIRLLLVDEFQDTDPVQSEIVRRLALEGDALDSPSLFVVGDPKQSIYGWRDADLAAYEAFESLIRERGGDKHELSVNFRSAQEILDEVEAAVAPVMRAEPGLQPPFRPLEAADLRNGPRPFRHDHWRPVEYWVSWRPDGDGGTLGPGTHPEATRVEAREVAEDILKLHQQAGVAWNDIALLFRKTQAQPRFLEALRRKGIPFAVNRDRSYYQRREVIDAAAWVRAVLSPADHLALLTVLRSITVGVPDAALIPLWTRSFPELVTELRDPNPVSLRRLEEVVSAAANAVPANIPGIDRIAGWERTLMAAVRSLARLRASYRADPPDLFIANLRRELLVEASESARFQGAFRLANLQRLFAQLETAMEADDADVHSILRALRLGVQQSREAEEARPRDAVEEAVQVMTIHTAKGLEFRHVYLVQMHSGTGAGGAEPVDAREIATDDWEYQLFGASTLSFHRAEEKTRRIELAEAVRTLYVALTRASERLVLVGLWPERPEPVVPQDATSYVDLLQNRSNLPSSLTSLANDASVQLLGYHDEPGTRWRFLGGRHTHGDRREPEALAGWLPEPQRLEQIHQRRTERRSAADSRMERALQAAVTDATRPESEPLSERGRLPAVDGLSRAASRHEAMQVGTALHRVLESWDLGSSLAAEAERQRARLESFVSPSPTDLALGQALEALDRLTEGSLLPTLYGLKDHLIGREVPVVLAPDPDETPEVNGPVGCFAGSIDLLYRDPSSGELVVADFKTDRLSTSEQIEERAGAYTTQLLRYARATKEAFALDYLPRAELWFLCCDTIWAAPAGDRS